MAIHRNLLGILVILALGVALVACTSASAAQNGNAGQAETGEISKLSSPPQGQAAVVKVKTDDAASPAVAAAPAETPHISNSFPATLGELRAMGLHFGALNRLNRDFEEFRWGWGAYEPVYQEVPASTGEMVRIIGFHGANTPALELLGVAVREPRAVASTPKYHNDVRLPPPKTYSEAHWPETAQTARELAARLYTITPRVTEVGTAYELEPKNIRSARIEPDKVLGVEEKVVYGKKQKVLVFTTIVSFDIEGEKTLRFRITSTLPRIGAHDPDFRILD